MLPMLRHSTKCMNTDQMCTSLWLFWSFCSSRSQAEAVVVSAGAEGSINTSRWAFSWQILTGSRVCLSVTVSVALLFCSDWNLDLLTSILAPLVSSSTAVRSAGFQPAVTPLEVEELTSAHSWNKRPVTIWATVLLKLKGQHWCLEPCWSCCIINYC